MNEELKQRIWHGIERYGQKERNCTLIEVYRKVLAEFFCAGVENVNGIWIPVLVPANMRPTFSQFRYLWRMRRTKLEHRKRHPIKQAPYCR